MSGSEVNPFITLMQLDIWDPFVSQPHFVKKLQ